MTRKVGQSAVSFELSEPKVKRKLYDNSADVIDDVGPFGRYQIYTCFVLQYSAIIGAGIFAFGNFGNLFPLYSCSNQNNTVLREQYNDYYSQAEYKCTAKNNCTNRTVEFRYFISVAEEWMLVCDRESTVQIVFVMTGLGRLLGSILGGHISDYWGRKRVLYPSQFAVCIISTLATACTQWVALAVFMFFVGFTYGMGECAAFVLVMEKTDRKHRWILNSCFQWCAQYAIVALIAYLTGYWRLYLIVINVILAPLLVFFLVFLESPRYLIYQNELDRAVNALSDLASDRWNRRGIDFVENQLKGIPKRERDSRFLSPLELVRTWPRARFTLTLMLAMFMRSALSNAFIQGMILKSRHESLLLYFGYIFKSTNQARPDSTRPPLSFVTLVKGFSEQCKIIGSDGSPEAGNPFINIGLYGLIRIWVPFFLVFGDRKFTWFGRRMVWMVFFGLIFLTTLAMVIMDALGLAYGLQIRIVSLLGAGLCASGGWMIIGQLMVEGYPTAIRGIAFGWISAFDGLGSMLALYIMALSGVWRYFPDVVFLVLCTLTLVTGYLVIPETKGLHTN